MGLLAHDFANQTIDWRNAAFLFAAAEHLGPMYIPPGQIGPGAFTEVFVFDSGGTTRCRSHFASCDVSLGRVVLSITKLGVETRIAMKPKGSDWATLTSAGW